MVRRESTEDLELLDRVFILLQVIYLEKINVEELIFFKMKKKIGFRAK